MTIGFWLKKATDELADAMLPTPRLDAEVILAHTLGRPRTWLHAHVNDSLDLRREEIANARIDLRLSHVPVAYIIGHKEFYGRRFLVNTNTLIPRPESEQVIELLLEAADSGSKDEKRLVDIGAGSGCLGITAKLEMLHLNVTLCDTSKAALSIAKKNAATLGADVRCIQSNLLGNYPFTPDVVLANLPYVDKEWTRSPDTAHEPAEALFAPDKGLQIIKKCFDELAHRMKFGGIAIFEADPRQWDDIVPYAASCHFEVSTRREYAICFVKTI